MIDFDLLPKRTALINVDLQTCFVRDSPVSAPEGPAVLEPDGSDLGVMGETSPPARDGLLNRDAFSAQLDGEPVVEQGDLVLDKPRIGAFSGTAREAMQRDFRMFFLSDGTAAAYVPGASATELQRTSLVTPGFLFAPVLTVDEVTAKIGAAA